MTTTGEIENGGQQLVAEVSRAHEHENGQDFRFKSANFRETLVDNSLLSFLGDKEEDVDFKASNYPDETSSLIGEKTNPISISSNAEQVYPASEPEREIDKQTRSSEQLDVLSEASSKEPETRTIEFRFLVRRREAGAMIGKRGGNIKRLRETFRQSIFSIPDTGNGPERVVCIATDEQSAEAILTDFTQLLLEKSPENDDQIEVKLLIHSSHAGSIIGVGGQSIKRLRNDSKAAIKIYEICCPLSSERVCAIKAKPPLVVSTIKLIQSIQNENPIKGTVKPYDALHFDLNLVDKYGGYLPDDPIDLPAHNYNHCESMFYNHPISNFPQKQYQMWRQTEFREPYGMFEVNRDQPDRIADNNPQVCQMEHQHHQVAIQSDQLESTRPLGGNNQVNNELNNKKRETIDSNEVNQANQPLVAHQPVRLSRFHPYAPEQMEFPSGGRSMYRYQVPMNFSRFQYGNFNQQHAGQCLGQPISFMSQQPDRFRPFRPSCSCFFFPRAMSPVTKAAQLAQPTKSFGNSSKGPRSVFKKK